MQGHAKPLLGEPPKISKRGRLYRRAVINSGLSYLDFGRAIGYEGKDATVAMRVQLKMRGHRGVTATDILLIKLFGERTGQNLFTDVEPAVKAARVKGMRDGRNS